MFFELIYYFTQDIVYNNYNKIAKQETWNIGFLETQPSIGNVLKIRIIL